MRIRKDVLGALFTSSLVVCGVAVTSACSGEDFACEDSLSCGTGGTDAGTGGKGGTGGTSGTGGTGNTGGVGGQGGASGMSTKLMTGAKSLAGS